MLADSRLELMGALAGLGTVVVANGGPWTAPAVMLAGGAPWVEPLPGPTHARAMGPGTFRVRWGVVLIGGTFDTAASQLALEGLVDSALTIVAGLRGWERPYVSAPRQLEIQGATYLTALLLAAHVYQLC